MTDGYSVYEEKNGRNNMILENDYCKKYKGHWNLEMICDCALFRPTTTKRT